MRYLIVTLAVWMLAGCCRFDSYTLVIETTDRKEPILIDEVYKHKVIEGVLYYWTCWGDSYRGARTKYVGESRVRHLCEVTGEDK